MLLSCYGVTIPQGNESSDGYVSLKHGAQYSICLKSGNYKRCAAEIKVDGKLIGTFRIKSYGNLTLERSTDDDGRFTFYIKGSSEASSANLGSVSNDDLGLVSVLFKPEKDPAPLVGATSDYPWSKDDYYWNPKQIGSNSLSNYSSSANSYGQIQAKLSIHRGPSGQSCAGGTGLSGQSSQKFVTVEDLDYADSSEFVTINLRLIGKPEVRQLKGLPGISTPVPKPVH